MDSKMLYKVRILLAVCVCFVGGALIFQQLTNASDPPLSEQSLADPPFKKKSKAELKKSLTPIQFSVTQQEDTEKPFQNKFWDHKGDGIYTCVVCAKMLFDSKAKFDSGTGWPSFYQPLSPKSIGTKKDWKLFYSRVEVHCDRCGAHLGHVFNDGPKPTGLRYCMNSASMTFTDRKGLPIVKPTLVESVAESSESTVEKPESENK